MKSLQVKDQPRSFIRLFFLHVVLKSFLFFFLNSANAYGAGSVLRLGDYFSALPHTCLPGVGCTYSTNRDGELTMYWALRI